MDRWAWSDLDHGSRSPEPCRSDDWFCVVVPDVAGIDTAFYLAHVVTDLTTATLRSANPTESTYLRRKRSTATIDAAR